MKKTLRIFTAVLAAAVMTTAVFGLVGCDTAEIGETDPNLGTTDEQYLVEGMSAYDLIMEAYANWCADDGYVRRERFAFTARMTGASVATRQTNMIRKVSGDEIYSQEVILGTGMDGGTKAIRYYFDGQSAWELENTDGSDISIDEASGLPVASEWGEFVPYGGDVDAQNRTLTEHLTTYDFSSREYLSDAHNDGVFLIDGTYYCTMTLDCSTEMMDTVHKAAKDEFLANTGAKDEGFSIEDTTIDFAIKEIDGQYKFVAWRRNEKYEGTHSTIPFPVSCEQTCYSTYSYEGYEIDAEDLLNLA